MWLPIQLIDLNYSHVWCWISRFQGRSGRGRRRTEPRHCFVWSDPFCTFHVHLWPCRRLASTHRLVASTHFFPLLASIEQLLEIHLRIILLIALVYGCISATKKNRRIEANCTRTSIIYSIQAGNHYVTTVNYQFIFINRPDKWAIIKTTSEQCSYLSWFLI